MRKLFLLLLFLVPIVSFSQEEASHKAAYEKILDHAEEASLYRNSVDWIALRSELDSMANTTDSFEELKPVFNRLIEALNDDHGRIIRDGAMFAYYQGETKSHHASIDYDIYNQIQHVEYPFHAELLSDGIGYVRIVALPMGDNEAMTRGIHSKVCELIEQGAESWIIDLRYNGGGNMFPMAESIADLIGEGAVGGAQGLTENENAVWTIRDGSFYYDDQSVQYENECALSSTSKVAVLTSIYTASSGEALAVLFKGREHTRFFGGPTYGLVTVTDWTVIDERTFMTISVSHYADRKGEVYEEFVPVDEVYPFAKSPLTEEDQAVSAALKWLEGK